MIKKEKCSKSSQSPNNRWATQPLKASANDFLAAIRSEIPVSLIATPRSELICEYKKNWKSIDKNPKFKDFDQVPLTDKNNHILGVYSRDMGCLDLREDVLILLS